MGAISTGFAIAGMFFLRYWQQSRDRLFALFALAFFILACNRLLLALAPDHSENSPALYLVRLLAFLIILYAIVDKNLRRA
ncbi:MAG: hypothetical protein HZC54_21040 [Verrucomicrobia bacterium]|nr:hypothetical protein [Verrucomicrobiota bacterium]